MTDTNKLPTYHPDEFKAFNKALDDLLNRLLRYTGTELSYNKIGRFVSWPDFFKVRQLQAAAKISFYMASFANDEAAAGQTEMGVTRPNQTLAQICDILLAALKEAGCVAEIYSPVVIPDELVTEKFQGLAERVGASHLEQLIALRLRLSPQHEISGAPTVAAAMQ